VHLGFIRWRATYVADARHCSCARSASSACAPPVGVVSSVCSYTVDVVTLSLITMTATGAGAMMHHRYF
jgi:hypothetical protein